MILATLFGLIAGAAWLRRSHRKWPQLFRWRGELPLAAFIAALWGTMGWIVQLMLEQVL
jgi:hypothetical protein